MASSAENPTASGASSEPWWLRRRSELLALAGEYLNAYVYDLASIDSAVHSLQALRSVDRVLFAMKANFNPEILRRLECSEVDFECVSPDEVRHLLEAVPGLDRSRILFTPNFAPRADYEWAREQGICITLDNLYPLRAWPGLFSELEIFVRVDPGLGRGHHDHVITAGEHSKFGIPTFEIEELASLVEKVDATVVGIHAHSGSGIPEADTWGELAAILDRVAQRFPQVRVLDLGGGLGVPSRPGERAFDLTAMDESLAAFRARRPGYEIWIEPGRFLVAQAGVLLTHVTQLKGKGDKRYVGVATGMNALIRPSLYGAHHEIVNLTRYDQPATQTVTIVGPICETGDTLGRDRPMPECVEGDVMLILNAGAYGRAMSSQYNLRPIPEEVVLPET